MHAGNGGRNVIGNDKGVGVSERVGRMWNFTGPVWCLKETLGTNGQCVSEKKIKKKGRLEMAENSEYLFQLNP